MSLIKDIKSSAVKEAFNRNTRQCRKETKIQYPSEEDFSPEFINRQGKFPKTNGRESFYLKFTGNKSKHELWD